MLQCTTFPLSTSITWIYWREEKGGHRKIDFSDKEKKKKKRIGKQWTFGMRNVIIQRANVVNLIRNRILLSDLVERN